MRVKVWNTRRKEEFVICVEWIDVHEQLLYRLELLQYRA